MDACRKKKIVHLCLSNFYIDNYSYQENILPKYHVRFGFEVTVIASLVSFDLDGRICLLPSEREYVTKDGYKVIRMNYSKWPSRYFCKRFRFYTSTYVLLEQERPDILFIHGTSFGDVKQVCKYLKKNPYVKTFADSHADWINSGRNWLSLHVLHKIIWRHYTRMLLPYLDKIYGVLPIRCDFLHQVYGVPQERITLLPMGVDDDAIPQSRLSIRKSVREKIQISDNDMLIVTGGKIDSLKNVHLLMDAVNNMSIATVKLLIFGTVLPEFRTEFEKRLSTKIRFVGWATADQVMDYMIASDVACFPGTHSTLWEQAVGLGLPCIFKDWNRMHHVDINGNCLFLHIDSEGEIRKSLLMILDPSVYSQMFQKAYFAAPNFLYSKISRQAIGLSEK